MIEKFKMTEWISKQCEIKPCISSCKKKLPMAIIYALWSQEKYIEFLKLSIYSQFKHTDASKADIIIFVSSDIYDNVCVALNCYPVQIIKIDVPMRKYSILNHDILNKYEYIVMCDCDTFFYTHISLANDKIRLWYAENKCNFYESLYKSNELVMLKDADPADKVLMFRKCLSPYSQKNNEEYHKWFESIGYGEIASSINNSINQWFLSCLIAYPKYFYSGNDWDYLCNEAINIKCDDTSYAHGCDETLFILYAIKNNKTIHNLENVVTKNKSIYGAWIGDFLSNPIWEDCTTYLLHPLHGVFTEDPRVEHLFEKIISP